ncbi:hypothetical protein [Sphingomonas montana]|uniref:hypothetical protein n=1 Tax=Sphingomonas montana TaxID=1843236 RepID=UPI00096C93C7|nr:hypothetical protein [Sphingomonas montana]
MFDATKPETPLPVIFFFDKAEILRDYEAFTVEPITVRMQSGAESPAWSIVAKHRFTSQRGPVAQFDVQLYAEVFCEMAAIVAAHV